MSLLDVLLTAGVAAGLVGMIAGSATATALLGSWALSSLACALGAPFYAPAWIAWDMVVIAICVTAALRNPERPRLADGCALLLFLPIWALYFEQARWSIDVGNGLVAVQMLIAFPANAARWIWRRTVETNRGFDPFNHLDRQGVAAC